MTGRPFKQTLRVTRVREGNRSWRVMEPLRLTSTPRLTYYLYTLGGLNSLCHVCSHFLGVVRLMYSLTGTEGNQIIAGRLF